MNNSDKYVVEDPTEELKRNNYKPKTQEQADEEAFEDALKSKLKIDDMNNSINKKAINIFN